MICHFVLSEEIKEGINVQQLLRVLSFIIDNPSIAPKWKARAMAIRIGEQFNWDYRGVEDLDGNPANEATKQKSLFEIQEAIELADEAGFLDKGFLYYVNCIVRKGLGLPFEESWIRVCIEAKSVKPRGDIMFGLFHLESRMQRAIENRNGNAIRATLKDWEKMKSFGEMGKLLEEGWEEHILPQLEYPGIKKILEESDPSRNSVVARKPVANKATNSDSTVKNTTSQGTLERQISLPVTRTIQHQNSAAPLQSSPRSGASGERDVVHSVSPNPYPNTVPSNLARGRRQTAPSVLTARSQASSTSPRSNTRSRKAGSGTSAWVKSTVKATRAVVGSVAREATREILTSIFDSNDGGGGGSDGGDGGSDGGCGGSDGGE